MKVCILTISFVLLSALLAFGAQNSREAPNEKVTQYISKLAEQESKRYSVGENFSGEFIPLPTEMESQLRKSFPKHRFLLAAMNVSIDANFYNPGLLIVVDAQGNVVGHHWDIFFGGTSSGFRGLLSNYVADSRDDAVHRAKLLFDLMVYPSWRVGDVTIRGRTIKTTFFTGPQKPWRIVTATIDDHLRFGPLHIINAATGAEIAAK